MDMHAIVIVLGALLAVSEALALIPQVKANSIFQLVYNMLTKALDVLKPKDDAPK